MFDWYMLWFGCVVCRVLSLQCVGVQMMNTVKDGPNARYCPRLAGQQAPEIFLSLLFQGTICVWHHMQLLSLEMV